MNLEAPYTVLGYGAPIVDLMLRVSQSYYDAVPGEKGGMELVDYETMSRLIEESGSEPQPVPGGSAANVLRGLASLGTSAALMGKIGRDGAGADYLREMKASGVRGGFHGKLLEGETPTTRVLSLVAPSGARTMRTFLGASKELEVDEIPKGSFQGIRLLHVEGYSLYGLPPMLRAMAFAKASGALISLDLASFEVVRAFRTPLEQLLSDYVDIVFANEDEQRALFGKDPEEGLGALASLCDTAIVMMGARGCMVRRGDEVVRQSAFVVEQPIDTTGAGDLFASGFLHAFLKGRPLQECACLGALCGAYVVREVGAIIPDAQWPKVKAKAQVHCSPAMTQIATLTSSRG